MRSLKAHKFKAAEWLMPEGERYKSLRSLEGALDFLASKSFERNDLVLALGGGVVGDLAGFSAAVYLRGVPLVQVPTTLLSQIDSSVGGKTAVNLPQGKNLVGAFHQPAAVLIDIETLATLPPRELVAGFCEMVKQALIASRSLFEQTVNYLRASNVRNEFRPTNELAGLITKHCEFKASIVAGDERESLDRVDVKSRKVLNFGHTTAHALEAVTNYRVFRHGEAVGYGLLVAGQLSRNLGLLDEDDELALREAVRLCGPLPVANKLNAEDIMQAINHDKKSLGGKINWVLLERIGVPRIVEGKNISKRLLRQSLQAVLNGPTKKKEYYN
ncbi:MAG: 3-dehydroquinate synthase [Blastocatellia bacterium]|nr:MAG: 3-dehydroquinate synthase [Blastocatellia bacterium]